MAENRKTMRFSRKRFRHAALLATLSFMSLAGWGQAIRVRSPQLRPKPQYVLSGSLSLSVSTTTVNFTMVPNGTAQGSPGVSITTTWDVLGLAPELSLYGWLSSPTAALSDGRAKPDLIPSSAVLGQMTTGSPTTYTPFTQTTPLGVAGAGLTLLNNVAVGGFLEYASSRTDVLNLEIDLSGVSVPAGTYNGTLTLQASIN